MDNKVDFKCMPIPVVKNLPILIEGGKFWKNNQKTSNNININLAKD